jgi:hypothetical protein
VTGQKLAGFDDAYMRHLEHHGATPPGYPAMTDSQRQAAVVATGQLHWVGPNVRAASGVLSAGAVGDHVQMFAPNPRQPGSSVSHWDAVLTPNQLMEPFYTAAIHEPDLELALFQDLGWSLAEPNISVTPAAKNYGNVFIGTARDQAFTVRNTGSVTLHVTGTSVTGPFTVLDGVDAFELPAGVAKLVTVRFTAAAPAGVKTGTLTFNSDDPETPGTDVALTGTAILPSVSIVASDPTATEAGSTTGAFRVFRTGPTTANLVVNYTVGGTATGGGTDYAALSGTVTIPTGAAFAPIVVTPANDTQPLEGNETVIVTLVAGAGYVVGTPNAATVTIVDNDQALQFTSPAYLTLEGAKLVPIPVTRLGPATAQVSVKCRTVLAGTAVPNVDYTNVVRTLVFMPGVRRVNCLVPIRNDLQADGPKTIHLQLDTPTGPGANLGSTTEAVLTVADNRAGIVQFAPATALVTEGATTSLKVIRTGVNLVGGVSVDYAVVGGTASDPADYTLANGTLTFNAGETVKLITLPTEQDSLIEGAETVMIQLGNVTGGASLGPLQTMTVTIVDDERVVQFTAAAYQVTEGATNAVIGLTRLGPLTGSVTVLCSTVPGGTAIPNHDYRDVVRTLTFAAGVRTQNCLVPIVNNTLVDGARTVNLELSIPPGGTALLGSPKTAQLTINDNDRAGTFRFGAGPFRVTEGGTGAITVLRSGTNLASGVTIDYAVTGGTATGEGTDYTLSSGTLTFGANQTRAAIHVPTMGDTLFDGAETVVVTLLNPSHGGTVGSPASTTLAILEGTQAQVRFLNGLCINPGCRSFTARLHAEEGYTWFSVTGVLSAYRSVKRPTLSNFVATAVEFPELGVIRFNGQFSITPNRRYRLLLTVASGGLVLQQIDEGPIPGTSGTLELQPSIQSIPGDIRPGLFFGPLQRAPAPALIPAALTGR